MLVSGTMNGGSAIHDLIFVVQKEHTIPVTTVKKMTGLELVLLQIVANWRETLTHRTLTLG